MTLCAACTDHLERDLAEVDTTVEDLWTSIARQDVGAGSVGSTGHATASEPLNLHAMETGRTLSTILTGWCDVLGHTVREPVPASSVLLAQIREVRQQDWAPVLAQELREALNDCRRAMDRAAERVHIGTCGNVFEDATCTDSITAIQGQTHGRCRTCGHEVDIAEYRATRIADAWHVKAPLPRILRALKQGKHATLPMSRVEWWIKKGKLVPAEGNLYTAAAVMHAFWQTPSGRKVAPKNLGDLGRKAS
ncbi:hypothetical protein [Arthrobacter sp. FW306-06-A]|uniref:hypothetical protein n=1 Tax=Arthrobacter sp. FW306-06-A TaxID=2879621 RepID=UPI001F280751|nr:hypothetical protein [Arthrobacter sp. FW306-06-A]UKA69568.1 hypothetical protein LFT49_12370 [Arthrobacter sp. FW306-06-A]